MAVDLTNIKYYVTAVLADGKRLSLENVAENIAWEENENELSMRLNLTIRDIPQTGGRLSKQLALCTIIYVHADWGEGKKEVFQGTIWEWEHSQIKDDAVYITAYDMLYYLQKSSDSKYYASGTSTKHHLGYPQFLGGYDGYLHSAEPGAPENALQKQVGIKHAD